VSVNLKDDPIAFVLERLWSDVTAQGEWSVSALLISHLASKDYATAFMLAVAMELDKAKRDESAAFWMSEAPTKVGALNELGKRSLLWFLLEHLNDPREIKGHKPPPPPIRFTDEEINAALTKSSPQERTTPCPPPPSVFPPAPPISK